jgi:hypothetical protein
VDHVPSDLAEWRPIASYAARLLARAFGLTVADVGIDAHDVSTWQGPNDALSASIEIRRRLDSASTAIYLRILRIALAERH